MPTSSHSRFGGSSLAGRLPPPGFCRLSKIPLIRREIREVLAPGALELLLDLARKVSEGGKAIGSGEEVFLGLMLTIDLAAAEGSFSEPSDAATALRLVELLQKPGSGLAEGLIDLAAPELEKLAGVPRSKLRVNLQHEVRAEGLQVFIDADLAAKPVAARRTKR